MRYIVAVDCEGVACAVGAPGGTLNDSRNWEFVRLQATREADAAVRGLFAAGATQVIVWDNHGGSPNLHFDQLDPRCDIALGVGFAPLWPGLEPDVAGVLLVGYHAMDGTVDGVMCHSFSSASYQSMRIDGQPVGEIAIHGALAGALGVPVIFAASDDQGVAEAKAFIPGIETVTTKHGRGWNAAISMHPKRAVDEIEAGVQRAVARRDQIAPLRFPEPLTFEIRYKRLEAAQAASRGLKAGERVDPYTVRWRLERLSDYF